MNKLFKAALFTCLAGVTGLAQAAFVDFDFVAGQTNNTQGPGSLTVNGVVARAFDNNTFSSPDLFWFRNVNNDHGLGICDAASESCSAGDDNELDNIDSLEIITLDNTNGGEWVELWVSSLDSGGTGGMETGTLLWSHTAQSFSLTDSFVFMYGDFGTDVEGDILSLAAASGFDATAPYLLFIAGTNGSTGGNNDYLVWKGRIDTPVPEPTTLGLLGLGMLAFGFAGRRRAR
jgi:hypothetical protein